MKNSVFSWYLSVCNVWRYRNAEFICTPDAVEIFGTEDVSEGEQIKLTCYFTDENISSLGWYKNYRILNSVNAMSTVKYEEDWIRTDLTISEGTLTDAGE